MPVLRIFILSFLFYFTLPAAGNPYFPSARAEEVIPVGNKICPVTGDEASDKFTIDYKGKRYRFCCRACIRKFKKNPKKYIAALEKGTSVEPPMHAEGSQ